MEESTSMSDVSANEKMDALKKCVDRFQHWSFEIANEMDAQAAELRSMETLSSDTEFAAMEVESSSRRLHRMRAAETAFWCKVLAVLSVVAIIVIAIKLWKVGS